MAAQFGPAAKFAIATIFGSSFAAAPGGQFVCQLRAGVAVRWRPDVAPKGPAGERIGAGSGRPTKV